MDAGGVCVSRQIARCVAGNIVARYARRAARGIKMSQQHFTRLLHGAAFWRRAFSRHRTLLRAGAGTRYVYIVPLDAAVVPFVGSGRTRIVAFGASEATKAYLYRSITASVFSRLLHFFPLRHRARAGAAQQQAPAG